jgi:hypothetical protein
MPNRITEICDWIDANTSLTKGTTLQVQFFTQDAPDRCVRIANMSGGREYPENYERIDFMVQAISRAESWKDASDDIYTVHKLLAEDRKSHFSLPTASPIFFVEQIIPVTIPQYLGQDEIGRHNFSCNYEFRIFKI